MFSLSGIEKMDKECYITGLMLTLFFYQKGFIMKLSTKSVLLFACLCLTVSGAEPKGKSQSAGSAIEGKEAVIEQIRNLFQNSKLPIVQTRKFVPADPYISVQKIPAKDELSEERAIVVYRLRFVNAKKALDAIEGIVGEAGTVEVSENQNLVILNINAGATEAVKASLLALDQPMPQVLVETQIVEVLVERGEERDVRAMYSRYDAKTGNTASFGINQTSPGQQNNATNFGGFDFFPIDKIDANGSTSNFNLALKWLQTSSDAKILASPNIIADLNSEATMKTGEEIPYNEAAVTNTAVTNNFKFKKTGINLRIKPLLINKDTVRLEIQPEINLLVRYALFPQSGTTSNIQVPVVSIRNISTVLTAADGEVIMLGGLYSSETTERLRKTPFLSDIPLVGELFTGKDATTYDKQLLFFMKIHILPTPYSVTTNPENTADNMRQVGEMLRHSKAIGNPDEKAKYTTNMSWVPDWFGTNEDGKPETATLADSKKDSKKDGKAGKDAGKSAAKKPAVVEKKK